jgi:hypothetical protein
MVVVFASPLARSFEIDPWLETSRAVFGETMNGDLSVYDVLTNLKVLKQEALDEAHLAVFSAPPEVMLELERVIEESKTSADAAFLVGVIVGREMAKQPPPVVVPNRPRPRSQVWPPRPAPVIQNSPLCAKPCGIEEIWTMNGVNYDPPIKRQVYCGLLAGHPEGMPCQP